jgi:hypothetical protein
MSGLLAVLALAIAFNIFNKVYQENYKKPWLYIAISAVFLGIGQIIKFFGGFLGLYISSPYISNLLISIMEFLALTILTYGILLEYLILKYYRGKFVKVKFVPVQEGTLGGELDLDVVPGDSYYVMKKKKDFLFTQFSDAVNKGFEGFLLTESIPREVRPKYKIAKTPIAWITQLDANKEYVKSNLDENSDLVDPIQLNNIITYIDTFLEQSEKPFIVFELDQILNTNNNQIVFEFLRYIAHKISNTMGVLICLINTDVLEQFEINQLEELLGKIE